MKQEINLYVCPDCGHKVWLPKGDYYCTACQSKEYNTKHTARPKMQNLEDKITEIKKVWGE